MPPAPPNRHGAPDFGARRLNTLPTEGRQPFGGPRPPGGHAYQERLALNQQSRQSAHGRNISSRVPIIRTLPSLQSEAGRATSSDRRSPPFAGYLSQTSPRSEHAPRQNAKKRHSSDPQPVLQGRSWDRPPAGPRTQSGYLNPSQATLTNEEWKDWPEVVVQIGGLPKGTTLLQIFTVFKQFGQMERMEIFEGGLNARIVMSAVREVFWGADNITVGGAAVIARLVRPLRPNQVRSPLNPSKVYKEKYRFPATQLDFGFMYQPQTLMVMHSVHGPRNASLVVDFQRKQIYIQFMIAFRKGSDPDAAIANAPRTRTDSFRCEVPFSHLERLFAPEGTGGGERTLIFPLQGPPKYGRQLSKWENSMIEEKATWWTIHETWMRQTAIDKDMVALQDKPISLHYEKGNVPVIDISRWTTLRLAFNLDETARREFDRMMDALRDFNLDTKTSNEFQVRYDKDILTPIWDYIQPTKPLAAGDQSWLTQLAELGGPSLSFAVQYQLEVCISNGLFNEYNIGVDFIDALSTMDERKAVSLLEHIADRKDRIFDPMGVFSVPEPQIKAGLTNRHLPEYCSIMRRATVTPTGIIIGTPSVEITNRVTRHYAHLNEHFLRVRFSDEKLLGRINGTDKHTNDEVFSRVYRALDRGVTVGDRHFQFLAFGNSQLREHGAYFFCPTATVKAEDIRAWMGRFDHINIVAKYASRLGQCFSTTRALEISPVNTEISDVERCGYCFTDGVGMISEVFATMCTEKLRKPEASCFQFRLGGHKGVLALEKTADNRGIKTRPSQRKFHAEHKGLEIVRCSQFATASLNRQLIIVMSCLGVQDEVFRKRLQDMMEGFRLALIHPPKALELLTKQIDANQTTLQIAALVKEGFMASKEPFVLSLLHLWRSWTIKYLKEKAKIMVPDGAFVLGVVDETGKLRGYYENDDLQKDLPEIFLQITDPSTIPQISSTGRVLSHNTEKKIVTGKCVIARNPSLHPGDVRLVNAVDIPELHHLVDVVVFPQTGDRPVPNLLSGGDLDGDDYIVLWDKDFTNQLSNAAPASYQAATPEKLQRPVEMGDVAQFFVNYMKNDRLGTIANSHLAWADSLSEGVKSNECYELAQLHSDAVDYPKSGVPATMPRRLRRRDYPHFMEKDYDKTYRSEKVLGQLYDMVERVDFVPCYDLDFNPKIANAFVLDPTVLAEAAALKVEYDSAVRRIMAQHDIETEFEVWSTFVIRHNAGNDYKFHEEMDRISSSLKDRFRKTVLERAGPNRHADLPPWVAAMYVVTTREVERAKAELFEGRRDTSRILDKAEVQKLPLMSFPWIFPEVLIRIVKGYHTADPADDIEAVELPFEVMPADADITD